MLTAKGINIKGSYTGLEVADEIVKEIQPNAEYMYKTKSGTLLFYPRGDDVEAYFQYEINGKPYKIVWTNKYEDLLEHRLKHKQLNIFDCQ